MGIQIVLGAALCLLFAAGDAIAAEHGGVREFSVYHSIESFTWREYSGGSKLLEEEGAIFGVGAAVTYDPLKTAAGFLTIRGRGELFGGDVDYDGQTQPPNSLPVKTDVVYFGTTEELSTGWSFPVGSALVEPFAGIGHRWWLRDLQDSTARNTSGASVAVQGYTEQWQTIYSKFGMDVDYRINDQWQLFGELGGKYPFYNTNQVDVTGAGTLTIRPVGRWSLFGELGARYRKFRMAFFYDSYRTDRSPAVPVSSSLSILQPESREDIVGARFSWCFR